MPDRETVIKSLHDISGFVASRVGFERAKNFMHTFNSEKLVYHPGIIAKLKDGMKKTAGAV